MKKFSVIVILIFIFRCQAIAQETWGIANSNFAGNMGIFLNPSSIVGAPYKYEFNLLSGDVFEDNNYIYLKKNSGAFGKAISGETISDDRIDDYYTPTPPKRAYTSAYLMGPSYIRNKGNTAWGIHLAIRNGISANKVPYHLAKFIYEGFDYAPQHGTNYTSGPFKSAALGWGEIGGTYAKVINRWGEKNLLTAGVTANFLLGSYGIFVNAKSVDYIVPNSQLLIVNNLDAEYGHSPPDDRDNIFSDLLKIRGYGGSITLGITYINGRNRGAYDCNQTADNLKKYNYRLGFSLLDFGMISFGKKGTRKLLIDNRPAYWPGIDTVNFYNWFYMDTMLSNRFYGNPAESRVDNKIKVFTPSAASIQFDYCLKPKYYLNASLVQRIPLNAYTVRRPNQVALTVRYETRKFEVDFPLSFFEYKQLALGASIRYGILVVGTDRLGTFTGLFDSTGFDFFFGFKWTMCDKPFRKKNQTGCDF